MLLLASESADSTGKDKTEKGFAKKIVDSKVKSFSEILNDFFQLIGISKTLGATENEQARINPLANAMKASIQNGKTVNEPNLFSGVVIAPTSHKPEDLYSASGNHSRQAMMLRMEHLFDEIHNQMYEIVQHDEQLINLLLDNEEVFEKGRIPSKPVVVGDAVPVPRGSPKSLEQLLEAALAHHNLGSFEESLKFLEAALIQLADVEHQEQREFLAKLNGITTETQKKSLLSMNEEKQTLYFDLQMYIQLCKGNVYQSCGDDEQSLVNFMTAWNTAKEKKERDWEIISLNSIGMLAYYNIRYDVALLCFYVVFKYRCEVSYRQTILSVIINNCNCESSVNSAVSYYFFYCFVSIAIPVVSLITVVTFPDEYYFYSLHTIDLRS